MAFRVMREHPEHFEAEGERGTIRIAKRALTPARCAQFQKMCKGGEVKKAEGGEVKPREKGMDLSKHKLLKETDTHWHIEGPSGSFRVAKKGIGKRLSDSITQHFAEGGEAEEVPASMPDEALASYQPADAAPEVAEAPPDAQSAIPDLPAGPVIDVRTGRPVTYALPPQAPTEPTPEARASLEADLAARNGGEGVTVAPVPSHTPGAPVQAASLVPSHTPGAFVAPAVSTAAAPPQTGTGVPGMAGIQGEVARAYRNAEAATQAQADVAKREAAESLIAQQKSEEQRQGLTAQWQKTWEGWQQRGQEIQRSILDQKIDPNHYWNQKTTGGKVSAAIGLILGGMGSGLTRQPNAALQVIENAIGRDLDAQKAELGKKETLLGYHMQQGHALQASYQLARADMLDAAAARLAMTSTKFAGDKAQAAAQGEIAKLQGAAAQARQQVAASGLSMQLQGLQIEQAKIQMAMSRAQMGALQAITSGMAGQGQPGQGGGLGVRLDPRVIEFLPDHMRERIVTLPDGSYSLARTSKDASETNKSFEGAALLRDKLQRYASLLQKHPHGVSSTLSPEDYAQAQALRESMITDINGLAGLNRFTSEEAKLYGGRIPDITSKVFRSSTHQAPLRELGREIDEKIIGASRQYLSLPRQARRPGA